MFLENSPTLGAIVREAVTTKIIQIIDNNPDVGKFREVLPIESDGDWGTLSFESQEIFYIGTANLIGDYVDDLPTADFEITRQQVPLRAIGSSIEVSFLEEARGRKAGIAIEDTRMRATLRAHEITHNHIAFLGATNWGLPGLLNHPSIARYTMPVGAGGTPQWTTKTAQEIRFDLVNVVVTSIENQGRQDFKPNRIFLAKERYDYIKILPYSALDPRSVLSVVIEDLVNEGVIRGAQDIIPLKELNKAGPADTPMMIGLTADTSAISYRLPEEPQTLREKWEGLHWRVPVVSATGGVHVKQPNAHGIFTDI